MKIWIDVRTFWNIYKKFFEEFLESFQNKNENDLINIYKEDKKNNNFFSEQILFLKKLLKDKNDILVSFEQTFPLFYSGRVFQIIPSLENILYPDLVNTKFLKKYSSLFVLKNSLKKSYKIICFNEQTKNELNEKLNISEDKIEIINPFFTCSPKENSKIDIKTKHCLTWDYIIYDNETGSNKNIKRFFESIVEINKETKLNIMFIWNKIANDVEIREMLIKMWLKDLVVFTWIPTENELWLYYKQSIWVIYPTIYDGFPFSLSNAINYNTPIISSNLNEVRNIFWNKINYFSPISVISIKNEILALMKEKPNPNYKEILEKYSKEKFVDNLISLIK